MRHLLIASILIFSSFSAAAQVPTVTGSTLIRVFEGNNSWNATLNQIGAGGSRPDSSFIKFSGSYLYKRITDNLYRHGTTSFRTSDTTGVVTINTRTGKTAQQITMDTSGNGTLFLSLKPPAFQDANFTNNQPFNIYGSRFQSVNVPYSNRPNYVWGMGWNLGTNGVRLNSHEAAGGIHFETYFQTASLGGGGATGMTEFHLFTIDTTGTTNRFLSSAEPWDGRRWASILTLKTDKLNYADRANSAVWSVDPQNNLFDFQDTTGLRFNEPRGFALSVKNGANSAFLNVMDFNGSDELEIARQNISGVRIAAPTIIGLSTTPARTLEVRGEARITDLTTDSPTKIVGADADGDLGGITVGTGLDLTAGTLTATSTGTVTGTGSSGRVAYWNGTSSLTSSANLTYDGTTHSVLGSQNSQFVGQAIRNSSNGSSAQTRLYLWNDLGTGTAQGGSFFLTSSGTASPYASTLGIWGQSGINKLAFAVNNSEKMRVTTTGLHIGGTADASQMLHVSGSEYITGSLGVKVASPSVPLDVLGNALITGTATVTGQLLVNSTLQNVGEFSRTSGSPGRISIDNATNSGFAFRNGGVEKWTLASYVPSGTNYSFSFYNQQTTSDAFFINGDDNNVGIGVISSLAARLHVKGAGNTSGTSALLAENSDGTDILTVRNDQMSAFGTTPVSTEKLLVRGATSDNTAKAFVAERSSGTDVLGVQNDGKVSVNNAAYTEALTVNGNTQTDMLILTNQTASTATGKVVYDNGSGGTFSGTMSLGDGTHALVMAPTLIERHVLDYLVNWSTGRKGAFWTVPARFDGYKIAKAYISVTAIGAGAGDDELTIEIGGVGEGVQVITAGTHTLVMNDVINTDDVITFNITAISATPAQGLHVSFELSKL